MLAMLVFCASGMVARAQAVAAPSAPSAWVEYAQLAGNTLLARLSDPANLPAQRLHAWVDAHNSESRQVIEDVVVSLWVDKRGKVVRSTFPSLGQAQADRDLRAVLTNQPLPSSPPRGMRQPMRLKLKFSPAQSAEVQYL